jgi:sulfur-oxidizing protein SoxA
MRKAGISAQVGVMLLLLAVAAVCGPRVLAQEQERKSIPPRDKDNPLTELISGYHFTPLKLRALQDDDFDNPGFITWIAQGEKLWGQVDGASQKACTSCHGAAPESMRGIGAAYPKFQEPARAVVNLEQRINICRQDKMKATPWPYGSDAMLAMSAYVKLQSRGVAVDVQTDGAAGETFAIGKTLYATRVGQFGMSCGHCHNEHYGDNLRSELLSQGHSNGYPAWQAKPQRFVSLHERVASCFREMRAEPYELGSPEMVALELYLAWRGKGLPVETPAVRR